LRDRYEDITSTGADVAAIGMGWPEAAAAFKQEQDIPFPLLVDRTKETYRALEMKRGTLWDTVGPQNWLRFTKGILSGHGVGKPKQDPLQMGGTLVVAPGGETLLLDRADNPVGDIPLDEVIAALR
jgi:hypothetical protein